MLCRITKTWPRTEIPLTMRKVYSRADVFAFTQGITDVERVLCGNRVTSGLVLRVPLNLQWIINFTSESMPYHFIRENTLRGN